MGKGSERRQFKRGLSSCFMPKVFRFFRRVTCSLKVVFQVLRNIVFYDVSLVCKVVFQVLKIMYEEAC